MSEFTVESSIHNKVVLIRATGYLDDIGGQTFRKLCEELIKKGHYYFVINLEKTPVINSTGLSALLDLLVQIIDYNDGEVAITGLSNLTKTALQMTGVLTLCETYPTENEALAVIAASAK